MRVFGLAIYILAANAANAQSVSTLMGGRQLAMANSSSTLADEWSLFNNVAGLFKQKQLCGIFAYEATPSLPGANRVAASFIVPTNWATAGIGFFKFGDALYNEQIVSAGAAHQVGITSLGIKVNYTQYRAEGFGTQAAISIDFGGITALTKQISIAAYVTNITQSSLTSSTGERLPTRLVVGVGLTLSDKVIVNTEIEKELGYPISWRTGIEYDIYERIFIRTGYSLNPNALHVGIGTKKKRLGIDYGLRYHLLLGVTHQASASYRLSNPIK
jgi:hypothetical protein